MRRTFSLSIVAFLFLLQVKGQHTSSIDGGSCYDAIEDLQYSNFSNYNTVDPEDLSYLSTSRTGGLLVIISSREFSCHGTITSWSGIIATTTEADASSEVAASMTVHFQVWRPSRDEEGTLSLVGSNLITFGTEDFSSRNLIMGGRNNRFYNFSEKSEDNTATSGIPFQPGDMIGCYIPPESSDSLNLAIKERKSSIGHQEQDETTEEDNLMVYSSMPKIPCRVSTCNGSAVMSAEVLWPILYPNHITYLSGEEERSGSGVGSRAGIIITNCTNDWPLPTCSEAAICNGDYNECSEDTAGSDDRTIPGLLAIMAAACVAAVCIAGTTASFFTIVVCKSRCKKRTNQNHELPKRRQRKKKNQIDTTSPFIVNYQADNSLNMSSLAEFLQYNMMSENNTESCRMSWV